ncbi:MAG: DNA-processing protein DprA [Candidatus Chromulinivorax sp.]
MIYHHIILHISLIDGIGPATIKQVLEKVPANLFEQLYDFKLQDFIELGLSYDRATKLVAGLQDRSLLEKELALIEKHAIGWTVLGADDYPALLAQIEQPPAVLYYQGNNIFDQQQAIAFVGSRKADAYARFVINKFIPSLVAQDWVIVSGGAYGVDSMVHDATVKAGGKTIVVLGSGLLHWYPQLNSRLFESVIASGGMIVSAFSLQTQPVAGNFPARNRIIAGLSLGTVVVQAAAKSGALITADFAVEQGRQVFAVPGSIEHGLHDGCHYLISQGAKLVAQVADITSELTYPQQQMVYSTQEIQYQLPLTSVKREKNNFYEELVNQEDKIILDLLLKPLSVDDLLKLVDLSLEDLMQKLFDLSLQGKIEQDLMGLWKRI